MIFRGIPAVFGGSQGPDSLAKQLYILYNFGLRFRAEEPEADAAWLEALTGD